MNIVIQICCALLFVACVVEGKKSGSSRQCDQTDDCDSLKMGCKPGDRDFKKCMHNYKRQCCGSKSSKGSRPDQTEEPDDSAIVDIIDEALTNNGNVTAENTMN